MDGRHAGMPEPNVSAAMAHHILGGTNPPGTIARPEEQVLEE
jgi:hypothetical protein